MDAEDTVVAEVDGIDASRDNQLSFQLLQLVAQAHFRARVIIDDNG